MVFLTAALPAARGAIQRKWRMHSNPFFMSIPDNTDRTWKRRRMLMCTQHLRHRERNCYRLAINKATNYIEKETKGQGDAFKDACDLHKLRIEAAAGEVNYDSWNMREALTRTGVHVEDRILANLAVWEPRTFRAIVALAAHKEMKPTEEGGLGQKKCGPGTEIIDGGKL
jgi:large subunit ribosomal protein L20